MEQALKYVNCNVCNADKYDVVFPENKGQIHRIVKCTECGLMYANPQTTGEIEGKNSLDDSVSNEIEEAELLRELAQFTREENQYLNKQFIQVKDHEAVLNFLDNVPKGALLDVGSYSGNFLDAARSRGWDVIGLEPLVIPAMFAEKEFGLKVLKKTLHTAELSPESFSAVTSFHVIEHIYDPQEFIGQIHSLLKKDGIMILETPTYDTFTFKILEA